MALLACTTEVMAFSCFTELMKRMNQNFPHGGAMDSHFANMRSLIQVLTRVLKNNTVGARARQLQPLLVSVPTDSGF